MSETPIETQMSTDNSFSTRFFHAFSPYSGLFLFVSSIWAALFMLLLVHRLEGWSISWGVVFIPVYGQLLLNAVYFLGFFRSSINDRDKYFYKYNSFVESVPCISGFGPWSIFGMAVIGWLISFVTVTLVLLKLMGVHNVTYTAIFWPGIGYLIFFTVFYMVNKIFCRSYKDKHLPARELSRLKTGQEGDEPFDIQKRRERDMFL